MHSPLAGVYRRPPTVALSDRKGTSVPIRSGPIGVSSFTGLDPAFGPPSRPCNGSLGPPSRLNASLHVLYGRWFGAGITWKRAFEFPILARLLGDRVVQTRKVLLIR